jgi:predicted sulfurtransferase
MFHAMTDEDMRNTIEAFRRVIAAFCVAGIRCESGKPTVATGV